MLVKAEEANTAKSSLTPATSRVSPAGPPAVPAFSQEVGDPAENEKPAGGNALFLQRRSQESAADNLFAVGIIIFRCHLVL